MSTFNFERDTKVYLVAAGQTPNGAASAGWLSGDYSATQTYEIQVQPGISFTQSPNTSEITANESGSTPIRGKKVYNDSLNPVEVSFTTYIRPIKDATTGAESGEMNLLLWSSLVGSSAPAANGTGTTSGVSTDTTADRLDINLKGSQVNQLYKFDMYVDLGTGSNNLEYKVTNCIVSSAEISFDIDGLAQVNWTIQGDTLTEVDSPTSWNASNINQITDTSMTAGFLTNKLSNVVVNENGTDITDGNDFTFNITGGSITFDNGISYLTPETLSEVDIPINHFTSTLNISGNFTTYLRSSASTNDAGQLVNKFLDNIGSSSPNTTNSFKVTINLGGTSTPYATIILDTAFLEVPTIDPGDMYNLTVNFHAEEATFGTLAALTTSNADPARISIYPDLS